MAKATSFADELSALAVVLGALEPLDGDKRLFVLRTATDRLGIDSLMVATRGTGSAQAGAPGTGGTGSQVATTELAGTTPKEFMRSKQPLTDVQRIACLAYHLTHARGTEQFKTADLTKLNTEAAGGKFSNAAVAVMNATGSSGFLAPAGGGKKQITALGEEVVAALPNQEQVKAVVGAAKNARRRRKRTKRTAKRA